MAWDTGSITSPIPAGAVSEKLKALVGGAGVANWSFVENVPAGSAIASKQTLVLTGWGAGDTFRLTYEGFETADIAYASDVSAAIDSALDLLPDCANGNWGVTRTDVNTYVVTFAANLLGKQSALTCTSEVGCSGEFTETQVGITKTNAATYSVDVFKCAGTGDDANSAGVDFYVFIGRYDVNEIQTITFTSFDATDTIKLTYNTHETSAITYSADISADIVSALEGLADFAPGDIVCTKVTTAIYKVEFTGAFAHTDSLALTVTNGTGGASGSVVETVKGANSGTLCWVGAAELYSEGKYKFLCLTNATAVVGTDVNCKVDYNGYQLSNFYYNLFESMRGQGTTHAPTLNTTGFTYQIKLIKDCVVIAFRVGVTESLVYAGLLDSAVDASKNDTLPLVLISNTVANCAFSNLPGVVSAPWTATMGQAVFTAWTQAYLFGSNATNTNDFWQGNKLFVYRGLVYHAIGVASYYLYGGMRGLVKPDILFFYYGGTVVLGDTVDVDGTTYYVMGKLDASYHYAIAEAT